jgi:hypothetical protein
MFTAKHNTAQSVDDVFLMNNTATEEYRWTWTITDSCKHGNESTLKGSDDSVLYFGIPGFWNLSIAWYSKTHNVSEKWICFAIGCNEQCHQLCWVSWKELTTSTWSFDYLSAC